MSHKKIILSVLIIILLLLSVVLGVILVKYPQILLSRADLSEKTSTSVNQQDFSYNYSLSIDKPIYGLKVNGEVALTNSNSFLRIVLVDNSNQEYLVYETYPLIVDTTNLNLSDACEETCVLNAITPSYLRIEGNSSTLSIIKVTPVDEPERIGLRSVQDITSQIATIKEQKEQAKIQELNNQIKKKGLRWTAGETSVSKMTYAEKKRLFSNPDGTPLKTLPNLQGFEYYKGGIFELDTNAGGSGGSPYPIPSTVPTSTSTFIPVGIYPKQMDYRNFQGENWLTLVKNQGSCGSCWVFGSTAAVEAVTNLYFNQHLDLDLSEQDVLSCSGAGNCNGGQPYWALSYYVGTGVVSEACYPYSAEDSACQKCSNWQNDIIRISGIENAGRQLKESLIRYGVLSSTINSWNHVMALVGWNTDSTDNQPIWIFKNSWGTDWGENGYGNIKVDSSDTISAYAILAPIVLSSKPNFQIACVDKDNDGYCYWGLSDSKPSACPNTCKPEKDCDDTNATLNINCNDVSPSLNPVIINDSWKYFNWPDSATRGKTIAKGNNYLFKIGGQIDDPQLGQVLTDKVFSTLINSDDTIASWQSVTSLPKPLAFHSSVVSQNYLYVLGGSDWLKGGSRYNTKDVYFVKIKPDGTIDSWSATTSLPQALTGHSVLSYNNYLYVLGGDTIIGGGSTNTYYAKVNSDGTLTNWLTTTPLPQSLTMVAATIYKNQMYILGGGQNRNYSTKVYSSEIKSDGSLGTWQERTSLVNPLSESVAIIYGNKLVLIGGSDNNGGKKETYISTINSDNSLSLWSNDTSLPFTLVGSSYVISSSTLFLDGYGYNNFKLSNNLVSIDLDPNAIQPTPSPFVCTACAADISKDGWVSGPDVSSLIPCWNKQATDTGLNGKPCLGKDVNQDGVINEEDVNCMREQFLKECKATPTPIPTNTPTPTPTLQPVERVFITSTTYNGNLGGLSGADAKCQARANAANLGGTWKAWLSDHATSASYRMTHNNGPYKLLDGRVVANDWADLTDGSIATAINLTELRTTPNYMSCVWTTTDTDGSLMSPVSNVTGCQDYSVAGTDDYSWCGRNGSTDSNWTKWSTDSCDQSNPLYCFEQTSTSESTSPTSGSIMTPSATLAPLACSQTGDINGDGAVNKTDYNLWLNSSLGKTLAGDCNQDGVTDLLDYAIWWRKFNNI